MFAVFEQLATKAPAAQPALTGYIPYGVGEFDGQGSGHDTYGTVSSAPVLPNLMLVNFLAHTLAIHSEDRS